MDPGDTGQLGRMIDKKIFHKGIGGVVFHKSLVRKISHGKNWQELPQFSDKKFKFARFNIFEKKSFPRGVGMEGLIRVKIPSPKAALADGTRFCRHFFLWKACRLLRKPVFPGAINPTPGGSL
jgi:hypothetical protein